MSDDESRATLPTSTLQHNIKLDAAILKKETPDRDAPMVAAQVSRDALQYVERAIRASLNETAAGAAVSQRTI
jgi:hypothetical protein